MRKYQKIVRDVNIPTLQIEVSTEKVSVLEDAQIAKDDLSDAITALIHIPTSAWFF